jgi:predicted Zn finger-like uncharacterized protein
MSTPTGVATVAIDPPIPNRMTRITPPPAAVKAKDNFNMGIMAAIAILAAAVCFWTNHSVACYVLGGLGLVFFASIFSKKADVGQCPYCMAQFRETKLTVKDGLLRCEQCGSTLRLRTKPQSLSTRQRIAIHRTLSLLCSSKAACLMPAQAAELRQRASIL